MSREVSRKLGERDDRCEIWSGVCCVSGSAGVDGGLADFCDDLGVYGRGLFLGNLAIANEL